MNLHDVSKLDLSTRRVAAETAINLWHDKYYLVYGLDRIKKICQNFDNKSRKDCIDLIQIIVAEALKEIGLEVQSPEEKKEERVGKKEVEAQQLLDALVAPLPTNCLRAIERLAVPIIFLLRCEIEREQGGNS